MCKNVRGTFTWILSEHNSVNWIYIVFQGASHGPVHLLIPIPLGVHHVQYVITMFSEPEIEWLWDQSRCLRIKRGAFFCPLSIWPMIQLQELLLTNQLLTTTLWPSSFSFHTQVMILMGFRGFSTLLHFYRWPIHHLNLHAMMKLGYRVSTLVRQACTKVS